MRRASGLLLGILACAAVGLRADLSIPADFRTVVNDASLVIRGVVTDVRAVESATAGVESVATIAVETVLKGQAGRFVYVRVPGGLAGGKRYVMVGAPAFRVGQRAVLFLRPGATDTAYRPIGLTMGVYTVRPDPRTRRLVVEPPVLAGATAAAAGPVVRGDARRKALAVAEFEALVRLAAASRPGQAGSRGGGR